MITSNNSKDDFNCKKYIWLNIDMGRGIQGKWKGKLIIVPSYNK